MFTSFQKFQEEIADAGHFSKDRTAVPLVLKILAIARAEKYVVNRGLLCTASVDYRAAARSLP